MYDLLLCDSRTGRLAKLAIYASLIAFMVVFTTDSLKGSTLPRLKEDDPDRTIAALRSEIKAAEEQKKELLRQARELNSSLRVASMKLKEVTRAAAQANGDNNGDNQTAAACQLLSSVGQRAPSGKPPCSYDFISLWYGCHGRFPSGGIWNMTSNTWTPSECALPLRPVGQCLWDAPSAASVASGRASGGQRVKSLVIVGDSQASRITYMLSAMLAEQGIGCTRTEEEEGSPDYYGFGVNSTIRRKRDCGGCDPFVMRCTNKAGVAVDVEYAVMEFLIDFEVSQKSRIHWDNSCDFKDPLPCKWAWNSQMALFESRFKKRPGGYPDAIAIFQNVHDCARRNSIDFRRDLRYLFQLINDTAPASTSVYIWQAAALNKRHQPMQWHDVTSERCTAMMHRHLEAELKPYAADTAVRNAMRRFRAELGLPAHAAVSSASISKGGSAAEAANDGGAGPWWYPTYGIYEASSQVIDWNIDGVHYKEPWYQHVNKLMTGLFCEP